MSNSKSPDAASPHATQLEEFVTVAPSLCVVGDVPLTPLVIPVSLFPVIPVYDISSVPICTKFVPDDGNCVASVKVISVADPLLPPDVLDIAPFKVVLKAPTSSPPQVPSDQPKPFA